MGSTSGGALVIELQQPAVGDGYPVGITRQVGQYRFGPGKRALCTTRQGGYSKVPYDAFNLAADWLMV